jgi:hypothetical protein
MMSDSTTASRAIVVKLWPITEPFGPFETDQAALDSAAAASDETAEVGLMFSPQPPLPVTDPGEVYPLTPRRARGGTAQHVRERLT